jgi:hypothetical protein
MLLMHFLNKVGSTIVDFASFVANFEVQDHFNTAMNSLELEIYHQISLNRLISAYVLLNALRPMINT